MLSVGSGAVDDDVSFLDALFAFGAKEETKRMLGAATVVRRIIFEEAFAGDMENLRFRFDDFLEQRCSCERLEIGGEMLSACDAVLFVGECVIWKLASDR